MSLFSSREWWQTKLGSSEEFDQGSICVANIDNDPNGAVKIITGSLQGVLRVHQPHQRGYHIEDILLEAELDSCILQLAAGNFLGGTSLCLAVLHPRKLAAYTLQAVGNSYLQILKLYEHYLEHSAANMAYGPFGGVTGVDHIVVQSYDGQLTFFEQEVQSFSRHLPGFLLPGPLAYVAASDCFVTSTAGLELVSYKYGVIAAAASGTGTQSGPAAGKRVQEDWKVVLGESALDIRTGHTDASATSILVLAEHTFFVLDLYGRIVVQRRLDYHPSCCWAHAAAATESSITTTSNSSSRAPAAAGQASESLLIATHSKALLVYRGQELAWAAQLELLPVAVRVTSIGGMRGMIVALDDVGQLSVLYLGTEPPKMNVQFSEARALDYAAMEQERRALLAKIQSAGTAQLEAATTVKAAADANKVPLVLRAKVPSRLDAADPGGFGGGFGTGITGNAASSGQQQLTVTLLLTNTTKAPLQDVVISVLAPRPIEVVDTQLTLPELAPTSRGSEPYALKLVMQAGSSSGSSGSSSSSTGLPASNVVQVVATYKGLDSQPGVSHLIVQLPMCLFCQVVPPVKSADFKVTVSTNREAVQLVTLFGDMMVQANPAHAEALSRSQSANMLSFLFPCGDDVSILVSKNGGRYRLQSNCFQAMWLVLQELARRLTDYFAAADKKPAPARAAAAMQQGSSQDATAEATSAAQGPFAITCDDAIPLQDLFDLVEQHFAARSTLASIDMQLEQQEIVFRSIQKRLLVRYKDRNAAPLNQLDVLMEEVYGHIMELVGKMEAAQVQLQAASQAVGAGVQLVLLLARFKFGLSADEVQLLSSCLSPVVQDGAEVSWEEMTEAAMTQLLRSCLARSPKDTAAIVPPLAPVQDTARLKKHISLVLERLSKGMRLSSSSEAHSAGSAVA